MIERRDIRLIETKASGETPGRFSGYGAVFGNVDATGDVIQAGAFAETLGEWKQRAKWPPMLLQHGGGVFGGGAEDMLPVGEWLDMEENRRGLKVDGQLFALGTEKGQYIYEGLKAGVLDGLSIGFQTRESVTGTRAGEPDRILTNLDLWEVSIVTFPANPKARVTAVKALTLDTLRGLEESLHEDLRDAGFSRADAKRVVATIRKYLQRDAGEPEREQRDAAAAGELSERLESLHLSDKLQGLLTHIAAGGTR
jgi:uncharacterized protein